MAASPLQVAALGFFGAQPVPPPPPQWSITPPSAGPFAVGLAYVIVTQVVCVPLCILAYLLKAQKPLLVLIAALTATIPFYLQDALANYLIDNGWSTPMDALAGRFCASSTYSFCAFRIFGAALNGTPKGADADLATWVTFAVAAVDPSFDKVTGKAVKPSKTAVVERVGYILLRQLGIGILGSITTAFSIYPATKYVASLELTGTAATLAAGLGSVCDHTFVHLGYIYLFLTILLDIGSLLLEVQGFAPIGHFDDPFRKTKSPRDFWGKRWNLQVTTTLKRIVFVPLRKIGAPATIAAPVTFVSSGFFHEYARATRARAPPFSPSHPHACMLHADAPLLLPRACVRTRTRCPHGGRYQFVLSFPAYKFGGISLFFASHAVRVLSRIRRPGGTRARAYTSLSPSLTLAPPPRARMAALSQAFTVLDSFYEKTLGKAGLQQTLGLPGWVQSLAILALFSPTVPYFAGFWISEGMFEMIATMAPRLTYA